MSNLNELKPVGSITPFTKFCCTIGNLPSSYMASFTYEEQLLWLCDYLQNTVIPAVNTNAEAVAELQELYVQLHDYVEHYFDNLDVQEEINNKLDEMANDGQLSNLLMSLFDEINENIDEQIATVNSSIQETKTELNNSINTNVVNLNTKIDSIQGGSPIPVASKSSMTDTSKIYLLTTDGNWYYYNNSEWVSGGVYISDSSKVSEVSSFLTQIARLQNPSALTASDWEQGAISYENNEIDSNNRIRSRYIELFGTNSFTISLNPDFQAFIAYYDLDNNMISYTDWYYNALRTFTINSAVKIRIVLRKSDETDITPSDYSNLTLYYDNISVKNILKTPLKDIHNTDYSLLSDEIFRNNELFYCININSNDCPSDFKGQTCLVLTTQLRVIPNRPLYQQFIFNNAVNKLFFRVFAVDIGTNNVTISRDWTLFGDTFNNNSPKNKWYVLGDSISSGYYSMKTADLGDLTPAISYDDGTCSVWDNTLNHNYWGYMNKWYLKRNIQNLAIPGQGYYHKANYNNQNLIDVIKNNSFDDASLITVAMGFNDWHYNMPRGNHDLILADTPIPDNDFDITQITTVNQAIWYCLGMLIKKSPNSMIVVQTPFNGWRYGGDFSTKWAFGYSLSNSGTLKDIVDDIIYWCDYYGLTYISPSLNNSIINNVNIKDTLIDGSHPSDIAHQQLARSLWSQFGYM